MEKNKNLSIWNKLVKKVSGLYEKVKILFKNDKMSENPNEKTTKLLIKIDKISKNKEYFDCFTEKLMEFKSL